MTVQAQDFTEDFQNLNIRQKKEEYEEGTGDIRKWLKTKADYLNIDLTEELQLVLCLYDEKNGFTYGDKLKSFLLIDNSKEKQKDFKKCNGIYQLYENVRIYNLNEAIIDIVNITQNLILKNKEENMKETMGFKLFFFLKSKTDFSTLHLSFKTDSAMELAFYLRLDKIFRGLNYDKVQENFNKTGLIYCSLFSSNFTLSNLDVAVNDILIKLVSNSAKLNIPIDSDLEFQLVITSCYDFPSLNYKSEYERTLEELIGNELDKIKKRKKLSIKGPSPLNKTDQSLNLLNPPFKREFSTGIDRSADK
jgi:hypothetical protein